MARLSSSPPPSPPPPPPPPPPDKTHDPVDLLVVLAWVGVAVGVVAVGAALCYICNYVKKKRKRRASAKTSTGVVMQHADAAWRAVTPRPPPTSMSIQLQEEADAAWRAARRARREFFPARLRREVEKLSSPSSPEAEYITRTRTFSGGSAPSPPPPPRPTTTSPGDDEYGCIPSISPPHYPRRPRSCLHERVEYIFGGSVSPRAAAAPPAQPDDEELVMQQLPEWLREYVRSLP